MSENDQHGQCCESGCGCSSSESDIKLDKIIEIDKLSDNSVIIIRAEKIDNTLYSVVQNFLDNYGNILEKKRCNLLILSNQSDISAISENQMNKYGWFRKEEKRIITL